MSERSSTQPAVVLVDRDPSRSHRWREWLEEAGLEVASFGSIAAFLEAERSLPPVGVLVATEGTGLEPLGLIRNLEERESPHAVALVGAAEDGQALAAVRAGAVDWIAADASPELVRLARRAVGQARFRGWQRVTEGGEADLQRLTPREHETLALVLAGLPSKAIAQQLGVTTKTVEQHRSNVMHKLEVASVAQLVLRALKTCTYGTPHLATPPRG